MRPFCLLSTAYPQVEMATADQHYLLDHLRPDIYCSGVSDSAGLSAFQSFL